MSGKLNLSDIIKYTSVGADKKDRTLAVRLNSDYQRKLKKIKEKLNIKDDAPFVRGVIDLYYTFYYGE